MATLLGTSCQLLKKISSRRNSQRKQVWKNQFSLGMDTLDSEARSTSTRHFQGHYVTPWLLQEHVLILRNTIVCGKMKTHRSNIKHCNFSISHVPCVRCILVGNSGTKQPIGSIFSPSHNYTLTYRFPVLSQFSQNARCAGFSLSGSHLIIQNYKKPEHSCESITRKLFKGKICTQDSIYFFLDAQG